MNKWKRYKTACGRALSALAMITLFSAGAFPIAAQAAEGLPGTWEGALVAGPNKLRVVLEVNQTADGVYLGTLVSLDQGGVRISLDKIEVSEDKVRLEARAVGGSFEGVLNEDRTRLKGTWTQGQPLPLEFVRTAKAAEAKEPAKPVPANHPLGLPLDLAIPFAPTPFSAGGKTHLAYELHITNLFPAEVLLSRLEVLDGDTPVAAFEGTELNSLLARPGTPGVQDKRAIGPGLRAVAYLWITMEPGARLPAALRHRITSGSHTLEGGAVTVSTGKPLVLAAPLRGSNWFAGNGPANDSIHRRAMLPVGGGAHIAQRFAIDWLQRGQDQKSFTGNPKENASYHAYGQEAYAVAGAVVAETKDDIPENEPGLTSRAVPMTLETIGGNYIVLDLGGGRFAFYAHLQPGSLRVKTGESVKRGQVLGLIGNSGNSTEPHLHFHVAQGQSPLGSEGTPYVLDSFELLGGAHPGRREKELPALNDVVRFADSQ
jgi:hypothetical protein